MKQPSGSASRSALLLALAVVAGVLLVVYWPRPASEAGTPGDRSVAPPQTPGELAAVPRAAGEEPAAAASAEGASAERQRQAARTRLTGVIGGPAEALAAAKVALVRAMPENLLTSLMGASSRQQLEGMEGFFNGRRSGAEQPLTEGGRFEFLDPPPGRWEVELRHPLLRLATHPTVAIETGKSYDLGLLPSEPAGIVVVVVTDRAGGPVANAEVSLRPDFDPMRFADPAQLANFGDILRQLVPRQEKTDAQGICRYEALPRPGLYRANASAKAHAPAKGEVEAVDGAQRVVRLVLGEAAALRVTVQDAAGQGVGQARVTVMPAASPKGEAESKAEFIGDEHTGRQRERTNASGTALLDACLPGKAAVEVEASGFLVWRRDVELVAGRTLELVAGLERGESVAGRVVDDRGQPLAGAYVAEVPAAMRQSVMGFEIGSFVPVVALREMVKDRGATTAADGRFELFGLSPAPAKDEGVFLLVVADGHAPARPAPCRRGARDLELRVERLGGVRGRVLGASGEPMAEFEAWVARTQALVFEARDGVLEPGKEPGTFVLTGLTCGKQTLVIEAKEHSPWRGSVEVSAEPTDLGDLRLGPASAIEGVTVDESGAPLEGVAVRVAKGGIADFESLARMRGQEIAKSDAEGRFRLTKVPERRLRLIAEKEDYAPSRSTTVRVEPGQVASARIELRRGAILRGRIADPAGKPLPGWQVQVTSNAQAVQRNQASDAEGRVLFKGLADGVYQVVAFPEDWIRRMQTRVRRQTSQRASEGAEMQGLSEVMTEAFQGMLRTQVTVASGSEASFELVSSTAAVVAATARVEGRVRVAGQPLAAGFVELMELGGGQRLLLAQVKDGSYELPSVAPGAYRSRVRAGLFGGASPRGDVVQVPAQAVYRLDLDLPGGRLCGRVVDREGKPVKQAMVQVRGEDERSRPSPFQVEDMAGEGFSLSDGEGRFRFEGLPAGSYDLVARELAFTGTGSGAGAVRGVVLAHGEQRDDLEVVLRGGGRIRVRVTADGAPKAGAMVRLLDGDGRPEVLQEPASTDQEGEATLSGLSAGSYRVLADADGLAPAQSDAVTLDAGSDVEVALAVVPGVEVRLAVVGERSPLQATEVIGYSVWDGQGRLVRAGALGAAMLRGQEAGVRVATLRPGRYRARLESKSLGSLEGEHDVPAGGPVTMELDVGKRTLVRR